LATDTLSTRREALTRYWAALRSAFIEDEESVRRRKRLLGHGRFGDAGAYLAIGTIVLNLLSLALPLSLLQVYDRIIPNSSIGTMLLLLAGVISAVVLESSLRLARQAMSGWSAGRFEHRAGCAAFDAILAAPAHRIEQAGTGQHLERMAALSAIKDFYADQGSAVLLDAPFVLVFLGLIGLLGGQVVVMPLACLIVFAIVMAYTGRKLRATLTDYTTLRDRRLNFVIEVLSGMHSVKSMAMEAQMLQRYTRLQESVATANHAVVRSNALAQMNAGLFGQIIMIATAAYGATLVISNDMTVGGLAACTLLAGRALAPVQRAVGIWTRLQSITLMRRRAEDAFREVEEMEAEAARRPPPAATAPEQLSGALELRDVTFRYQADGPDVLSAASLTVEPGECVGILGTNGSGKTTLLDLLRGMIEPTSGEILVDGLPPWTHRAEVLRRDIAYLPQRAHMFRGTILENITTFRPELRQRAEEVVEDLRLSALFAAMPHGWNTRIADGAADALPGGIRQRIAIARALIQQPRIILFDEANMSIDGPGDDALRAALERRRGEVTMVLVTLRPSLLKLADRRFELVKGRLLERQDPSMSGLPRHQPPPSPPGAEQVSEGA
jgi:ATP-binding cassette subfamily C protein LapB